MSERKAFEALDSELHEMPDGPVVIALLNRYIETREQRYWKAARVVARTLGLSRYMGNIRPEVMEVIESIGFQVEKAAAKYYWDLKNEMGFVPFVTRQRFMLDSDDAENRRHVEVQSLARTQANSVMNKLKKYYVSGQWDGELVDDVAHIFIQANENKTMRGCYTREDMQ
jgi:hypothetical protein